MHSCVWPFCYIKVHMYVNMLGKNNASSYETSIAASLVWDFTQALSNFMTLKHVPIIAASINMSVGNDKHFWWQD